MKQLLQAGGLGEACTVSTLWVTEYEQTPLLSSTGDGLSQSGGSGVLG